MIKFSPDTIIKLDIPEIDVEGSSLEKQEMMLIHDHERLQKIDHADRDMQMKETWSLILGAYLVIFTLLMFLTLWLNSDKLELEPTTLNFLITVGFAKVIGVVWAIVSHLFPSKK